MAQNRQPRLHRSGQRISEELLGSNVPINLEEVLAPDPTLFMPRVREAIRVLRTAGAIREVGDGMMEWVYKRPDANLCPRDEFVYVTNEELERAQPVLDGGWIYTNPSNRPGGGSQQYKVLRHSEINGMQIYHFERIPQNVASASTTTHGETSGKKRKGESHC